jgi:hypothetical protein
MSPGGSQVPRATAAGTCTDHMAIIAWGWGQEAALGNSQD